MPEAVPQELTDEQATKLEEDYLEGKFTETGPVPEKAGGEKEEEKEEEEEAPSEEGPAVKENQRLRQKNREVNERLEEQQRQLETLSARINEVSSPKEEPKEQTAIQKASTEELIKTQTQLDMKLYEAMAESNTEAIGRITDIKSKVTAELMDRPAKKATQDVADNEAKDQWVKFEETMVEAIPDLKDKSSDLYKAADKWAGENKALMKAYGDLGGVLATAQALIMSKSTSKSEKQAITSVTKEMEKIAESSVSKPASTSDQSSQGDKNYSLMPDADFEKTWNSMVAGETPIP